MNTIPVNELRANLMKVIKEIKQGSIINITSRGKVVSRITAPENNRKTAKNILKRISKNVIVGDFLNNDNS